MTLYKRTLNAVAMDIERGAEMDIREAADLLADCSEERGLFALITLGNVMWEALDPKRQAEVLRAAWLRLQK